MQEWIAGLIVVYAFRVVAKRYMPKAARRVLRAWMMRAAKRLGWNGIATRLAVSEQATASCSAGCGSCGGCGSNEALPSDERFAIKLRPVK